MRYWKSEQESPSELGGAFRDFRPRPRASQTHASVVASGGQRGAVSPPVLPPPGRRERAGAALLPLSHPRRGDLRLRAGRRRRRFASRCCATNARASTATLASSSATPRCSRARSHASTAIPSISRRRAASATGTFDRATGSTRSCRPRKARARPPQLIPERRLTSSPRGLRCLYIDAGWSSLVARWAQSARSVDTKLKGDIAEQAAILQALKRGWGVLKPSEIGCRTTWSLTWTAHLVEVQVKYGLVGRMHRQLRGRQSPNQDKSARNGSRGRTQQRTLILRWRTVGPETSSMCSLSRCSSATAVRFTLVEADKRQRKPRSADFRDAWELIPQWAAREETCVRPPVKFGEAAGGVTPSQALSCEAQRRCRDLTAGTLTVSNASRG